MKKDYTHISVILDRSGSMNSIKNEIIGGFNSFLEIQQKEEEEATLTLVQFDSGNPYEVIHKFRPVREIPKLTSSTFVPRGLTPLLDAIGKGIRDINSCIKELKKEARPEKVVVVIITDGQENASREFNKEKIVKMINKKKEEKNWQFVFMSSDLDAIEDAKNFGVNSKSTLSLDKDGLSYPTIFAVLSDEIVDYRKSNKDEIEFPDNEEES